MVNNVLQWLEQSKRDLQTDIHDLTVFDQHILNDESEVKGQNDTNDLSYESDSTSLEFKVFSSHPDRFEPDFSKPLSRSAAITFDRIEFPD